MADPSTQVALKEYTKNDPVLGTIKYGIDISSIDQSSGLGLLVDP